VTFAMPGTFVLSAVLLIVAQASPLTAAEGARAPITAGALRPIQIRLAIDNRTLDEMVADLSTQASMSVMLPPEPAEPIVVDRPGAAVSAAPRRFSLHVAGTVSFWEAVDRVGHVVQRWPAIAILRDPLAPLHGPGAPVVEPDPKVVLVPASRDRGFACADGVFRIVVARLSYGRDIRFTPPLFPQPGATSSGRNRPGDECFFTAELIIMVEPRLKFVRLGDLSVHEAIDDRGQSLFGGGQESQPLKDRQGLIPPDAAAITVPLAMTYPSEPGKLIKRLRGSMPIEVSGRKGGTQAVATVVNFEFADIPMP
jgi:hypothetical protein